MPLFADHTSVVQTAVSPRLGLERLSGGARVPASHRPASLAQKTIPAAGLCNGAFLRVQKIENEDNEIEIHDPQSDVITEVPCIRFAECFLSATCVSYQVTQGKTIAFGTVGLWQTQHRFFTPRHLRVGRPRATATSDVYVH